MDKLLQHFRALDLLGYLAPGAFFLFFAWSLLTRSLPNLEFTLSLNQFSLVAFFSLVSYITGFLISTNTEVLFRRFPNWYEKLPCGVGKTLKNDCDNRKSQIRYKKLQDEVEIRVRREFQLPETIGYNELLEIAEIFARKVGVSSEVDRRRSVNRFSHGLGGSCLLVSFLCLIGQAGFSSYFGSLVASAVFLIIGVFSLRGCRDDHVVLENEVLAAAVVALDQKRLEKKNSQDSSDA